jgi:tetratricopeptide (TPR) repeat protein
MTELELAKGAVALCREMLLQLDDDTKPLVELAEATIKTETSMGGNNQSLKLAIEALGHVMHNQVPAYMKPFMIFSVEKSSAVLKNATDSQKIFKELGSKEGELAAACLLADTRVAMKETEKGLRFATKGLQIAQELGDKKAKFAVLNTMVHAYCIKATSGEEKIENSTKAAEFKAQKEKNLNKAIEHAKEAVKVIQELDDKKGEANARLLLAEVYLKKESTDLSMDAAKQAQSISQGIHDLQGVAHAMFAQVNVHITRGSDGNVNEGNAAITLAMDTLKLFENAGDTKHKIETMITLSTVYSMFQLPGRALETSEEAMKLAQDSGDSHQQLYAAQGAIGIYEAHQNYDPALKIAKECFEVTTKLGNEHLQASSMYTIGRVMLGKAVFDYEIRQEEEYKVAEQEARAKWTAIVTDNDGSGIAAFQEAVNYCTTAIELFQKCDDEFGQVLVMECLEDAKEKMAAHYMARMPPNETVMKTTGEMKSSWEMPKVEKAR